MVGIDNINICCVKMFGLSTSKSVAAITMLVSIVLYFGANSGLKQNAFIFVFAVALTILIVGMLPHIQTISS